MIFLKSKYYINMVYLFYLTWIIRLLMIINRYNLVIILIGIELMNFSLMFFILNNKNNYSKFYSFFKYFLFQSVILYLLISLFFYFRFNFYRNISLLILLITKMNIFPRHLWINEVFFNLNYLEIFIIRVISKIPIILLLASFFNIDKVLFISIFFTLIWSCFSLFNYNKTNLLFSFTSLNSSCWLVISIILGPRIFLLYLFFVILLIRSLLFHNKFALFNNNYIFSYSVLNIARFPIRTIFLLKTYIFFNNNFYFFFILLLLLINRYLTYIYFKFMFFFIRINKISYNSLNENLLIFYLVFIMIFYFFI